MIMLGWRNSLVLSGTFPLKPVSGMDFSLDRWFAYSSALLALRVSAFVEELDDRSEPGD